MPDGNGEKRDWMAAVALHALIARVPWPDGNAVDPNRYAEVAVGMADALIAELDKVKS